MNKVFESKTNVLLLILAFLAIVITLIAAAIWGQYLFDQLLDFFKYIIGGGVARAATNDGLPRAVEAFKKPDEIVANTTSMTPPPTPTTPDYPPRME